MAPKAAFPTIFGLSLAIVIPFLPHALAAGDKHKEKEQPKKQEPSAKEDKKSTVKPQQCRPQQSQTPKPPGQEILSFGQTGERSAVVVTSSSTAIGGSGQLAHHEGPRLNLSQVTTSSKSTVSGKVKPQQGRPQQSQTPKPPAQEILSSGGSGIAHHPVPSLSLSQVEKSSKSTVSGNEGPPTSSTKSIDQPSAKAATSSKHPAAKDGSSPKPTEPSSKKKEEDKDKPKKENKPRK